MYPKTICERYECTLGTGVDVIVLGVAEGEKAKISNEFMALLLAPDKTPEQFQADTFDDVVTRLARDFNESEDTVRTALVASAAKERPVQPVDVDRSFLGSAIQRLKQFLALV